MNKNDLKATAGISSASVVKLGKGENITTDVLLKICESLNVHRPLKETACATLFLGEKEKDTLKDLAEILGKETIDLYNTSDTRGTS